MSADPLVDKVAAAMWERLPDNPTWAETSDYWKTAYRDLAWAAIRFLRDHDRRMPGMRQVDEAELVLGIRYRLSRMSATRRKTFASASADSRRVAEQQIAEDIVRKSLGRFEILSSAPLPDNGFDLFTKAAFGSLPIDDYVQGRSD